MNIFKNILIPISTIFVLGVLLVMNLFNPSPNISSLPETTNTTNIPQEETEQTPIFSSDTAPILRGPLSTIKSYPLPQPIPPKTSEIKTPKAIIAPKPTPPAPMPILPIIPPVNPLTFSWNIESREKDLGAPFILKANPQDIREGVGINEDDLMKAVVRIRCGNIFGSGFSVNPDGLVISVAHVVIDAIEKETETCDVIFPAKHPSFGFYSEAHYRKGTILLPQETKKFYKEQAIDVAMLQTSFLPNDPVFPEAFPYINYPFCGPDTLGDKILLFGYAANLGTSAVSLGSILSRFEGEVLRYEDITGVKPDYFPETTAILDETTQHPITIIFSNNNFSGASGGLVFNISKNCVIGANSAVGTIFGDPKVYGFIFNFSFPAVKAWIEPFFNK